MLVTLLAQSTDLGKHAFFYVGESHDRTLFVVKGGKVVWSFEEPEARARCRTR